MDQYIFPVMWIQGHMFLVVWAEYKKHCSSLTNSTLVIFRPLSGPTQCQETTVLGMFCHSCKESFFYAKSSHALLTKKKCFISFLKMKTLFLGTRSKDSKVKSEMNENKAPGAFPQIKPWLGIRCLTPGIKCFPLAKTQKRGFSSLVFGGTLPCPQLSTWPAT